MDCREARRAMSEGGDSRAEAHLRECPACAELFKGTELSAALDSSHPEVELDLGADLQRLQATMDRSAGPLSSLPLLKTRERALAAFSVGVLLLVMVGLLKLRPDLAIYPRERWAAEVLFVLVPALALGWSLLRPSFARQPSSVRSALTTVAGVLAPWLIVALALVSPHEAHSSAGLGSEFWPRAIACFAYGSAMSVPLALALFFLSRRDEGAHLSLSLFIVSGVFAALVLVLHCPIPHAEHLALGHASIVVVAMAAGWALGRRGARRW